MFRYINISEDTLSVKSDFPPISLVSLKITYSNRMRREGLLRKKAWGSLNYFELRLKSQEPYCTHQHLVGTRRKKTGL